MSSVDRRLLPIWVWFSIGAGGALVGLLPWLVTGARLPLQNLAADQSTTVTPFALLPFSQYFLATIVALLVVGAAAAGIAGRALGERRPRFGTAALVFGMLAVQLVAIVQSSVVTVASLERSTRTAVYAGAVVAVMIVSILVGLLVGLLIARAPVPGATIGLALAAIVSASWAGAALREVLLLGPNELVQVISFVLRWMPGLLVGCAIAWCGFRTGGRIAAVIVSLAALWIGPAFFTAVSAAAGTRVLAAYPREMADYAVQVFLMALTLPELVLPSLVVALVVGVAGSLLLDRLRRKDPGSAAPAATASESVPAP
ncbi:hypothetical protein [Microbacterium sp. SS28]|uniref:hypothetical protein n=1 Tax=Microbacterium sp. SS28 TaxID=2919948 RepID=UPI001FAB24DD|nr:hypothetical protein [Microbacterium sp. SS28]